MYTYDDANRVKTIEHVTDMGVSALKMTYSYNKRDLPTQIAETNALGNPTATVTFTYDDRGRLIAEQRVGDNAYDLAYAYDVGGNRRTKTDAMALTQVIYAYDIDAPLTFGTANNRLMTADTTDISACDPLISSCPIVSTDYYLYNFAGNVLRVVTETVSPTAGEPRFNATRYIYARNAQTVSYVLGETWNPDGPDTDPDPDDYTVTFAREFRYDSARARYLDRQLAPAGLMATPQKFDVLSETWTDYDNNDNNTYTDFTVTTDPITMVTTVANGTGYELGTAKFNRISPTTFDTLYAHNDHIGTLRAQSNSSGFTNYPVYTAFGERITNSSLRYGYAGTWGFESGETVLNLHVGRRYYQASSGRFLQRDPIGLLGGENLYSYVGSQPTARIDPTGQGPIDWVLTGSWNPPPGIASAAYDEFSKSVSDRTLGTGDAIVSDVTVGWVNSVGGKTFDPINRANADTTGGHILGTTEWLCGAGIVKKLSSKLTKKIGKRLLWEVMN